MVLEENDGRSQGVWWRHSIFTLLICLIFTHSGFAVSGGQDGIDLTIAMRNYSDHFKTAAFHTDGVARYTDWSGRHYSGHQSLEWVDFGAYRLMYVAGESIPDLIELGKRNSQILRDATSDVEWASGAVAMGATGVNGRDISHQVEKLCNVEVQWLVGRDIKVSLSTGEHPIKKRDACEVLVWVLSAQNIKIETAQKDGKTRVLLFDSSK